MKVPFFFFFFLFFASFIFSNPLQDLKKLEIKTQMRAFFDYMATPKSSFLGKVLSSKIKNQRVYDKFMIFHESAKQKNQTIIQHVFNTYLEENNIVKESWTCFECKKYAQYLQGLDNSTRILFFYFNYLFCQVYFYFFLSLLRKFFMKLFLCFFFHLNYSYLVSFIYI